MLIVPDKFKGTLTATAAANAIARGWRKARPADKLELLPMSDGGDGFGEVMSAALGAKKVSVKTVDAAQQPIRAHWWWESKSKTAIIESANVIGLALLPAKKFHPFELDTYGLGAVILAAAKKGARRCFIGIGGSATNDGGFGVARALGWVFLDHDGKPITQWTRLDELASMHAPKRAKFFAEFIVAVDVQNPLLGPRGCTRIYGPQKGLTAKDFPFAERCLRRFAQVAGFSKSREPGAGAAGGLGFGLRCFAGARLQPGFDLFAEHARLSKRLRAVDLVITGEGAMDASTLMGKGVGQIAARCSRLKIPCIGLAGTVVSTASNAKRYFAAQHGLTDLVGAVEAKRNAAVWLERLAEKVAQHWRA